jgi:hypothetical protein
MAFRRQDIAKTTRKGGEGEPRRLYPRYAKDKALLPKIDLAVGYLDSMVGRRRGDLAPDALLDLFGDPKLARCFLACLAENYRYRTPTLAESLGAESARRLSKHGLRNPTEVRAFAYLAANQRRDGFVVPIERGAFVAELAAELGVSSGDFEGGLHLDAERNAVLVRTGERPNAPDVRARYNATLTLSTLRHASEVTLVLPGLGRDAVEAMCDREGVSCRWQGADTVRLLGRRSALGSFAQFGVRLARLATGLILISPGAPAVTATIYLNGQPLAYSLEGFALGALRHPARAAAGPEEAAAMGELLGSMAAFRRKEAGALRGWTLRRATEPLVVDGAIVMPELICLRDEASVVMVTVPADDRREAAEEAVARIAAVRPVVALGDAGRAAPGLLVPDAAILVEMLDAAAGARPASRTALGLVAEEVGARGWVSIGRLEELFGNETDLGDRLRPLTADSGTTLVPGIGLCRSEMLTRLAGPIGRGPLDIAELRASVASAVGEGPAADALTLHLLTAALPPPAERRLMSTA